MNKNQAAEQISTLFQSAFNRDDYTHFLRNLLNEVEPRNHHYSGNMVPDAFKQHVNQYWRIGKYIDPEEAEMDLYVVEVKSLSKLIRARTELRNFAVRTMQTFGGKDHALIASYAKEDNGADWRFSYVKIEHNARLDEKSGKVKAEKEITPAKRFSYLVGEHENSHTAQAQLVDLLAMDYANPTVEEIEEAFSIEKVTREFFEQYKDLFIRLSEVSAEQAYFLQETDEEKRKQDVAKFSKKLLGQIVFLYFLQKKGWLGVTDGEAWGKGERRFLQKLFADADRSGQNYYVEKLQYLFYEALANDRKDQFDPSYYKKFDCRIPFLNGGLFEADYDWQKIRVEIPNAVFFNNEETRAGDKGTGIFNVFDRYNFTIKEDDPLEKEVAIDPEMLGKVFENMLKITERKSKGAFYTPREIVHYMCQESLIHYLNGEVGEASLTAIPKADIEILVHKGIFAIENDQDVLTTQERIRQGEIRSTKKDTLLPQSIQENAGLIDEKLADIKICDPAIGSGAFPVGMLHEILHARQALKPHLPVAKQLSSYNLKKHTIGNSIYGVDIDPSAIDIARLRLWLSLVVDEDDYTSIDALPNLDYKIMQGNSLIEEYAGVKLFDEAFIQDEDDWLDREKAALKQKQTIAQTNFFAARNAGNEELEKKSDSELKEIDKEIQKIKQQKRKQAKERSARATKVYDLVGEAREKANQLESLHQQFFDVSSPAEKRKLRDQITALEWELIEATLKEQGKTDALTKLVEYKTSGEKPWFLWKLNFSEVFKHKGGFDIVIANPPYIKERDSKEIFNSIKESEWGGEYHTGKMDFWFFFLHRAFELAFPESGAVSFITSRYWINSIGAKKLINHIKKSAYLFHVVDIGKLKVFDEVAGHHMIHFYQVNAPQNTCMIKRITQSVSNISAISSNEHICVYSMTAEEMLSTANEIRLQKELINLDCINSINNFFSVTQGVVQNPDKVSAVMSKRYHLEKGEGVFVLDQEELAKLCLNEQENMFVKPFFEESCVHKFYIKQCSKKWLLYLTRHNCQSIEVFSNIERHLSKYRVIMDARRETKKGTIKWFQMHWPREERFFENEKVAIPSMFKTPKAAHISFPAYFGLSSNVIIGGNAVYTLKVLALILNSQVAEWWFFNNGKHRGVGVDIGVEKLRSFPLPKLDKNQTRKAETIVDYIKTMGLQKDKELEKSYWLQLADSLAYGLYFPEEIKAAGKEILPHLGELTPLTDEMNEEDKLAVIQLEFVRLYDPNHPVRNHLETLDSVEEVRIIRESLKK